MPLSSETGSGGLIKPKGWRSRSAYVWRLVLEFWISLLLGVRVLPFHFIPVDSVHKHVSSSRFLFSGHHIDLSTHDTVCHNIAKTCLLYCLFIPMLSLPATLSRVILLPSKRLPVSSLIVVRLV